MGELLVSKLSIVIPCLNEIQSIDFVYQRLVTLRERLLRNQIVDAVEWIVVDDGSTDGSTEKLRSLKGIKVLRHEKALGYGRSLKDGFQMAEGEWLACFDMDATYDPLDVGDCLIELQTRNLDIVFGIRPFFSSGMPIVRSIGNSLFSAMVRWFVGHGVSDIASGLRVFHRRRLKEVLGLREDDFQFGFSFTVWPLKAKWKIGSLPINYGLRKGDSKLIPLKDGIGFLRVLVNYGWRGRQVDLA